MSRQNKVNPGQYTQRGRLAQDDIARELTRQRASIGSPDTWQPERHIPFQAPASTANAEGGEKPPEAEKTAEPAKTGRKKPVRVKAKAAKTTPKAKTGTKPKTKAKTKTAARTVKAKRPVRRQTKTRKTKQ